VNVPEPVRKWVYSVLVTLMAVGVVYGIVSAEQSVIWLSVAQAVLAVPAVEAARSRVSPVGHARVGNRGPAPVNE
jgi:hypothetical protein